MIVAVTGLVPVLIAANVAILPVPLAARPMDGVLLVQLYTVPAVAPVKLMAVVEAPLQTTWLVTVFTVGTGFTVMVNIVGVPVQVTAPLVYEGVTVIVAVTGTAVALVAVNEPIFPVPLAARPMDGVLLIQLYTVPIIAPEKLTAVVDAPLHTV